jgi:hypothetical protein
MARQLAREAMTRRLGTWIGVGLDEEFRVWDITLNKYR